MSKSVDSKQFSLFKDCLARRIIAKPGVLEGPDDLAELDDFTHYLASEAWHSLPPALHEATYSNKEDLPVVDSLSLHTTPTAFIDTLTSCGLTDDADDALVFLRKVLDEYISEACAPPPIWSKTRTTECEMCEREVPLTYHHLIPRETHAKVVKKKWHSEAMLNSVAWLCREKTFKGGGRMPQNNASVLDVDEQPLCD
ncbi:hypothetical protein PHLCEN_2v6427 [Hermanssonia centrifuga]|uniref:Uncharacterized protein n=1 Tax=Hermanssonia centrifuga TaxID=98765 RepID=A0A2R6NZE6_9APHY|nr:hypothetical protein PHLCEN_2v6427 [Hermanssonia centrifuga]